MSQPIPMVEIWRGALAESIHFGQAVICGPGGEIVQAWGDPDAQVLPRSSCKMLQALPLIESGAAAAYRLGAEHLALACASHSGAAIHTDRVNRWLTDLGLGDDDLRCGGHLPYDPQTHDAMLCAGTTPCQMHNNCSGKHAGFLTLTKHLGAGPEYIDIDHPVQRACLAAYEEVTGITSPGYGIDGCSAPNHITTLHGMARAMAFFANARDGADARQTAAVQLWQAMVRHPELVAGEGRACTELMRACKEPVALKTGAEAFYIAILPQRGLGIALKIADGTTRGSQCAIAALLVRLGVLDADHPTAQKYMNTPISNARGTVTGVIRPSATFL
ncbi:asparaginase [Roseovarius pelagicus]|uniref:Asparaginase n=1 Tax=Roseovarius pelagicus TaxID=2980108 RepID=A0ABY6D8C9_9RHOB|nr:asparaginase [Roseovarius pelagicus]UXX82189.1 asparaginase [Roseovarius pelagicus]